MNPPYLGVDHIGVAVQDLDAALKTYRDILGFNVEGGEELPERGLRVAFVDAGNTRIELIAPSRADSEVSAFLQKRGPGIHHICLQVADIAASAASLQARGARLVGSGIRPGAHGSQVVFLHPKDNHGVLIELVQLPGAGSTTHPAAAHR